MLVDYESASDSDDSRPDQSEPISQGSVNDRGTRGPPPKRRKVLPSVPASYTIDPGDDPTLHQGRIRSRPFVPGELNAHVYLTLKVSKRLRKELDNLVAGAQRTATSSGHTVHSLLSTPTPSQRAGELHVSLTHPLPLRISQIEAFRSEISRDIRQWARTAGASTLRCSLSGRTSVYFNGKATGGEGRGGRAFLALRLGAGSAEVNSIIDKAIHPLLAKYHLPLYHTNPEYHASFAWCLLAPDKQTRVDHKTPDDTAEDAGGDEAAELDSQEICDPHALSPFTADLLHRLDTQFERRILEAQPKGGWELSYITFRVGKKTHDISLS